MASSVSTPGSSGFHQLTRLATWKRLALGLLPVLPLHWLLPATWPLMMRLLAAWTVFGVCTLLITWAMIFVADVGHIRRIATREDPGRALSFGVVLTAATASLVAVVLLLSSMRQGTDPLLMAHVVVSSGSVVVAWLLVHTLFTVRYAHLFYNVADARRPEGGLEFPGNEKEPDYLDFAYFAFVIGMTAQTADVSISDRRIRRLALLHGLLSFGFNTAVVALTISGLSGLL